MARSTPQTRASAQRTQAAQRAKQHVAAKVQQAAAQRAADQLVKARQQAVAQQAARAQAALNAQVVQQKRADNARVVAAHKAQATQAKALRLRQSSTPSRMQTGVSTVAAASPPQGSKRPSPRAVAVKQRARKPVAAAAPQTPRVPQTTAMQTPRVMSTAPALPKRGRERLVSTRMQAPGISKREALRPRGGMAATVPLRPQAIPVSTVARKAPASSRDLQRSIPMGPPGAAAHPGHGGRTPPGLAKHGGRPPGLASRPDGTPVVADAPPTPTVSTTTYSKGGATLMPVGPTVQKKRPAPAKAPTPSQVPAAAKVGIPLGLLLLLAL